MIRPSLSSSRKYSGVAQAGTRLRVGDQHARCVLMRAEYGHRLATLHQQRLVVVQLPQRPHDGIECIPACGPPCPVPPYTTRSSGRSATSGSRLFMSIRSAASCVQPLQDRSRPRGARIVRACIVAISSSFCWRIIGKTATAGQTSSRHFGHSETTEGWRS